MKQNLIEQKKTILENQSNFKAIKDEMKDIQKLFFISS